MIDCVYDRLYVDRHEYVSQGSAAEASEPAATASRSWRSCLLPMKKKRLLLKILIG